MATPDPNATALQQARALLRDGKTQEADDLLSKAIVTSTAAGKLPAALEEPKQPRKPEEIILDLFQGVHQLLGTSPALVPLIAELREVLAPPAEKPAAS